MASRDHDEGRRTPEQIEHELEETRSQIGRTIDAIQKRVSPGELANDAYGYLRNNGGRDFVRNFGTAVKNNPVPVALVGLGLAWLMTARGTPAYLQQPSAGSGDESDTSFGAAVDTPGKSISDAVVRIGSRLFGFGHAANDAAADASDRVRQMSDDARTLASEWSEDAGSVAESAREQVRRAGDTIQEQAAHLHDSTSRMLQDQPFIAGALGIAIGAALGALLPLSRRENELMGEARDELLDRAAQFGRHAAEQAADAAAEAVKDEAEKRGPAADGAPPEGSGGPPSSDQTPGTSQTP